MRAFLYTSLFLALILFHAPCFSQLRNALMLTASCTSESGISSDQTAMRFLDEATDSFDSEWDAYKFMNPSTTPNLYSVADEQYAINAMSNGFINKSVVLNFKSKVDGTYSISANEIGEFDSNWSITLVDRFTSQELDLRKNKNYSFTSAASDKAERFMIKFRKDPIDFLVTAMDANNQKKEEYVFATAGNVYIHLPSLPISAVISICDISGEEIIYSEDCAPQYEFSIPETGIYTVHIVSNNTPYNTQVYIP